MGGGRKPFNKSGNGRWSKNKGDSDNPNSAPLGLPNTPSSEGNGLGPDDSFPAPPSVPNFQKPFVQAAPKALSWQENLSRVAATLPVPPPKSGPRKPDNFRQPMMKRQDEEEDDDDYDDENDSATSSEDEEEAAKFLDAFENVKKAVETKDPSLYDPAKRFFDEDEKEEKGEREEDRKPESSYPTKDRLSRFFTDKSLTKDEVFLRKYILQRMWVDDEGKFDKADGETEQQPLDHVDVDEDEGEIENMARHEASYNFRFENIPVTHTVRYDRKLDPNRVASTATLASMRRRERKKQEKAEKAKEKKEKRREVMRRLVEELVDFEATAPSKREKKQRQVPWIRDPEVAHSLNKEPKINVHELSEIHLSKVGDLVNEYKALIAKHEISGVPVMFKYRSVEKPSDDMKLSDEAILKMDDEQLAGYQRKLFRSHTDEFGVPISQDWAPPVASLRVHSKRARSQEEEQDDEDIGESQPLSSFGSKDAASSAPEAQSSSKNPFDNASGRGGFSGDRGRGGRGSFDGSRGGRGRGRGDFGGRGRGDFGGRGRGDFGGRGRGRGGDFGGRGRGGFNDREGGFKRPRHENASSE